MNDLIGREILLEASTLKVVATIKNIRAITSEIFSVLGTKNGKTYTMTMTANQISENIQGGN